MVQILVSGNRKMMKFNSSRNSVHRLIYAFPFTLRHIWSPLDGIDLGVHLNLSKNYHLIHSFNRIPFTKKPWIVTFEAQLPRTLGSGGSGVKKILRERLLLENCKKIIAMSEHAKKVFINYNKDCEYLNNLLENLEVIHPNIPVKITKPKSYNKGERLHLIFIGNAFARKGGIVVLRLAKKADKNGLPVVFHIISGMQYGAKIFTDHPDASRYEEDLKLINLNNIVFHQKLINQKVLNLLSQSHFQIMPTLNDTYGFSIIEGFSVATPAITTNVCALPEIVCPNQNGYLLELEVNENQSWRHPPFQRGSQEHWDILDSTYNNLADQALNLLLKIFDRPEHYEQLSAGAIAQASNVHDSQKTGELLDNLYSAIVND